MSESVGAPRYHTGRLWGILALLLLLGTVAAAAVVFGFTDLLATGHVLVDVPIMAVGAVVASLALLLLSGLLYRVDRIRGVIHREVKLFE